MILCGFADEAGASIERQIAATKVLNWRYIESRNVDGMNIHDLPDDKFEEVAGKLKDAGIGIYCFGSAVANWGCDPFKEEDFERSKAMLKRALARMEKMSCTLIRGMSFLAQDKLPAFDPAVEKEVFPKLRYLVGMCADAGVTYAHENCRNYGGQSPEHTLKLLDEIQSPNFKLIFDTGNPVMSLDRFDGKKMQSSWDFYSKVREFICHVHIKDARFIKFKDGSVFPEAVFTYPGDGDGDVVEIVADLVKNSYGGAYSMEPHLAHVFHDGNQAAAEEVKFSSYVEYGRRFEKLYHNIVKESVK